VLFQMESVRCLFADNVDKIDMVFDMTGFGIRNVRPASLKSSLSSSDDPNVLHRWVRSSLSGVVNRRRAF
jgi:hypothetical protein